MSTLCLCDQYVANEWNESLDSVLGAEDDSDAALAALGALRNKWAPDTRPELCEVATISDEQKELKEELLDLVTQLKARRRIIGEPCTLEELLDPEEWKLGRTPMDLKVEMLRSSGWYNGRWPWQEARLRRVRTVALTIKTPK